MFASRIKKQIEIGEGDEKGTVTIRKLSARSLDKAREARQIGAAALTSRLGSDLIKAFRETAQDQEKLAAPTGVEAHYSAYDRATVLTQGVEHWTFKESLKEGLEDLDEAAAELLFRAIVDLSDPPKTEVERVEKNV
jgi:hypothetical protein